MFEEINPSFKEGDAVYIKLEAMTHPLVSGLIGKKLVIGEIKPNEFESIWFTLRDGLSESNENLTGMELPGGIFNTVFSASWFSKIPQDSNATRRKNAGNTRNP